MPGDEQYMTPYLDGMELVATLVPETESLVLQFLQPECVWVKVYENEDDMTGTVREDAEAVILKAGQEALVASEFSNKEMWFVNEYSGDQQGLDLPNLTLSL
jgi:regulator of extracellular matrix RemA (YlzA/DUF370 family)